mgnify:CR=1 FL=1
MQSECCADAHIQYTVHETVDPRFGSENGVGTIDIIENRLVGMKSRGVYETPGGTILFAAHKDLEKLILDRDTLQYRNIVSQKFARSLKFF